MTPPTDRPAPVSADVASQDTPTLLPPTPAEPLASAPPVAETLLPPPPTQPSSVPAAAPPMQTLNTLHGEAPATAAPAAAATMAPVAEKLLAPANYEIVQELGHGAMGVVYLARQTGLGRLVALKMILHADHASANARRRFLREAETLAQVKHEHVVQVHDFGEHDGKPFICLEYVEGGNLADRLAGKPQPARAAAVLVERLADAMQAVHAQGIVHRDLKPANVLLQGESAGGDWRPKITDFGLAKKQDAAGLTMAGGLMGTPEYMPPEQAEGKAIDARADVYSLGAILYECLTGRPPFRAATVMDTLKQVVEGGPVPPRQLNPGVPPDLETICLKCLDKEPGRRYDTARGLAEELRRFQAGEPILARPVGRLERGWRWVRRNPMVASLLSLVLLLMGLGTGISWILALRAENEAERAREQKDRADGEAQEAKEARQLAQARQEAAQKARDEEEQQRKRAEANEREMEKARDEAERTLSFSRIALARQEWAAGNAQGARVHLDAVLPKLRHWEHGHLYGLAHNPEQTFLGHRHFVFSVAFSPDGNRIVCGSGDHTVKVWDARTGQEALTLTGHTDYVSSVAFSPDGKRIVSGSWDKTVKVWDAQEGQPALTLKGYAGSVYSVAFSPDGKHLVSGSYDGTVKVWDAQTGQEALTFKGHTSGVSSVAFSPEGKRIVSGSDDKTVKVWDAQSGQEALTLKGHAKKVLSVAVSADGKRIVSGSEDYTVKVWDAQSGQEVLTFKGHTHYVRGVAFSPDGKRIVSGSADGAVKVWDAQSGQEALTLKGDTYSVFSVAFSPDGRRIVSSGGDNGVKVWDAQTGREVLTFKGHGTFVYSVAFSPDGKHLVSGGADRRVKVWDAQTGQEALTLMGHTRSAFSVAFSSDGKRIVSGSWDRTVKVWDAQTGREALTLKGHTSDVYSVAFSPDGKRIVSGSDDNTAKVWDAQSGQEALTLKGHTSGVSSVAFSPDGKRIISGSTDRTVKVWDSQWTPEVLTLKGHTSNVTTVAFSPNGKRIVSGSWDNSVKVWDARTGQEALTLVGHTGGVTSVAVTADGKRIVSGSDDKTVKVWDAQTGQEALTLMGHTSGVSSVAVTADGKSIISTDQSTTIVWDAATGKPLPDLKPFAVQEGQRRPEGVRLVVVDDHLIHIFLRDDDFEARRRLRLTRMALPDPAWHVEQTAVAEAAEEWFAASFHLKRLSELQPWDTETLIRQGHQLLAQHRPIEAVVPFLQALTLTPAVPLWPLSPAAGANAMKAAKQGDWPRAALWAERAAQQPKARRTDPILASLTAGRPDEAARRWRVQVERLTDADVAQKRSLVFLGQFVPLPPAEVTLLTALATELLAIQKDAVALHRLGAAQYRSGQHAQAATTLEASIALLGKDGYVDTRILLAMTRQSLGQHAEARRLYDSFAAWLKAQDFETWQEEVQWRRLHEEAKQLILTMPRAEN